MALQTRDLERVLAQLQQRLGANVARELRVANLVRVRAQHARRVDLEEKVCAPDPLAVEERGLVDDVPSFAHRLQRLCRSALELILGGGGPRNIVGESLDAATALHKQLERVVLMSRAGLAQQGGHLRLGARQVFSKRRATAELRQVVACEEVREVGGGEDQPAVAELAHQRRMVVGMASLSCRVRGRAGATRGGVGLGSPRTRRWAGATGARNRSALSATSRHARAR